MKLALDTNAYRLVMEGNDDAVNLVRAAEIVLMPVPVIAELRYGFLRGTKGRRNEAFLVRFLDQPRVEVLLCDEVTTHHYALLKDQLKRQGTPIPINDVWIAALVVQHAAVLLTRDCDFDHLPQLPRA
ncbi:MAG: type II toxin-antitoxin system VapC family toxin [Deltaproteobacteria bacterium]|nr:type II toxin-antitoxin system VapC family toxin [Deltaproteobacteria bacterium]MDQ3301012.1 type II toxin-antitoxin system VapC family toxin [Myxococcota bacterium]